MSRYCPTVGIMFRRFDPLEAETLADLLTSEEWPYHAGGTPTRAAALDSVAAGYYDGDSVCEPFGSWTAEQQSASSVSTT
jgi:hypothetical protein